MVRLISALLIVASVTASASSREWSDASGKYHVLADLIARDHKMVVLEKGNKQLLGIAIDQLSKKDQEFLAAKQKEDEEKADPAMQTWTMFSGLKIRAAVVEYVRRDLNIRRIRGKVYVNDKRVDNLPGVYRRMLPQVVNHFEGTSLADVNEFTKWVKGLKGTSKKYTVDGVMLEFENGDLYGIPFFFFSEEDLKILEPGWEKWLGEKDEKIKQQYSLSLRAEAIANRREQTAMRQVALLQLQLTGYQAGLFDLWEVALFPGPGVAGMPLSVVVPARNSAQAQAAAISKYPGYRAGPAAKARRKF